MTISENVCVAIRVRPLLPKDIAEGARECLRKVPGEPQLVLGTGRAFAFDHVFAADQPQEDIEACLRPLVEGVMKGLNATILAYGQTGSGKTHTMGSSAVSADSASKLSASVGNCSKTRTPSRPSWTRPVEASDATTDG
jgi:kinesin family protein 4/21/27